MWSCQVLSAVSLNEAAGAVGQTQIDGKTFLAVLRARKSEMCACVNVVKPTLGDFSYAV